MKGYLAGLLLAAAAAWPGSGCKDENPELALGDSPSDVVFPASNVLYGQHVQRLFNQACALSGCHDDGAHQSALKLTSYSNLMFQLPGIVNPGKPDESELVFRIEGRFGRMPPTTNLLNDNQINGIRIWIAEGAKNN